MRKILLSVVACCAVIAILPASALAHGRHHHKRHHHHHAHHARIRDWGGSDQGGGQTQNAGTVQSFTGGVLTIALSNGQTVSGQVTGDTEIKCETADMSGSMRSHDRHGDSGGVPGDGNDQGDDDQGQGDDDNGNAMCSSSDLTAGTVVHEAELRVSSAGAVWDKVELVTQASSSSGSQSSSS